MTTAPVNAAVKALTYAEEQLGVHSVYDEARENYVKLDNLMTDLGNARDKKRTLERDIQDREFEIMSDERSKHPEMSAASMDKHLKLAYQLTHPFECSARSTSRLSMTLTELSLTSPLWKLQLRSR
jgi:hypothetical protein